MSIDTLWYTRCPAPTAASIAIRERWLEQEFARDGIAVKSLASAQDTRVHQSHYNHSQPNSFRFGGYVPPLVSASRGADLRVIGLSWPDRTAAVLALPDSDMRSPADLRGARLSVPRRRNDKIDWWRALVLAGYESALDVAGMLLDDVRLVEVSIERPYMADATVGQGTGQSLWGARSQFAVQREEIAALLRGEVDAIYSDAAMGEIVKAAFGLVTVVDLTAHEDTGNVSMAQPLVLTATGSLVEQRPDLVARWISRLLNANAWASEHEARVLQIIAQDTGLPEDFVHAAYSSRIYRQLDVSLTPLRVKLLEEKCAELHRWGFLEQPLDVRALVDSGPLQQAQALWREGNR
jgi:ABC-type nitrate/sulfonate/bicarbonate transport system substrate-binding protein